MQKQALSLMLLLLLPAFSLLAQTDQTVHVVKYLYTVQDPTGMVHTERMLLLIGKEMSAFKSYDKFVRDSTIFAKQNLAFDSRALKRGTDAQLYKIYYQNKGLFTRTLLHTYFWEEDWPFYDWNISPETTTLQGLTCQKATTYSPATNTEWTVWFTPDVPFSVGPGTLHGLPGLIVKAENNEKTITYELLNVASPAAPFQTIEFPQKAVKITKSEYNKMLEAARKDPVGFATNSGALNGNVQGVNISPPNPATKPPKKERKTGN
ncbi:GLPGLI family protein [Rufibacter quisquiliarum]|uniref:GLPGLI family protein n=1 Tax=Rufibacter quisquiliarum TaxID=1549639 RepID=A0A839GA63_9BACT|nr:GLPGLI family protein [Rufibacter quisquiliarum]MBA9076404.1 GLPGLI family protein [Rufibacter quisquiliarum]